MNKNTMKLNITLTLYPSPARSILMLKMTMVGGWREGGREVALKTDEELVMDRELDEPIEGNITVEQTEGGDKVEP